MDNDNELLYLISEKSDEALEMMFKKYQPLIFKEAHRYHFNHTAFEDVVMTGNKALEQAIKTFNPHLEKTFNKYFQLVLKCRLLDLYRKDLKMHHIVNDENYLSRVSGDYIDYMDDLIAEERAETMLYHLSKFEKEVYYLYFDEEKSIEEIAQILNKEESSIVNAIFRIRYKYKKS